MRQKAGRPFWSILLRHEVDNTQALLKCPFWAIVSNAVQTPMRDSDTNIPNKIQHQGNLLYNRPELNSWTIHVVFSFNMKCCLTVFTKRLITGAIRAMKLKLHWVTNILMETKDVGPFVSWICFNLVPLPQTWTNFNSDQDQASLRYQTEVRGAANNSFSQPNSIFDLPLTLLNINMVNTNNKDYINEILQCSI